MTLLGIELSDAGILVAGDNPARLLAIDGQSPESPGFALPDKKGLLVGNSAVRRAHLFPLKVNNKFWDRLNTEPLKGKIRGAQNHAEIACAHLSHIWETVKAHGDEMIVAVPDYYGREQLGLILGMGQELSIPIKGFVSLPVAASPAPRPDAVLLHLDIHLHRFEVVYLLQGEHLTRGNSVTVEEINLERLYRVWVESIAEEFVRSTRFDPLHQAVTEQALYDRLSDALGIFKRQPSCLLEIPHGRERYRITLSSDLLKQKSEAVYDDICRSILKMRDECGGNGFMTVLQMTHRISSLPGLKERVSEIDHCEIVELEPGAGALGILGFWHRLPDAQPGHGTSFFTSRPWQRAEPRVPPKTPIKGPGRVLGTHLLYGDMAYPVSEEPLFIGRDLGPSGKGIHVTGPASGVSKKHCTVQREAGRIVLRDYSVQGTFVEDRRVDGSFPLELGQTIRLGPSGDILRLIVCMKTHET